MSHILLDKEGREVLPGSRVYGRANRALWYVTGHDSRSVFVVRDLKYPPLHAQGYAPDVFGLRIEER